MYHERAVSDEDAVFADRCGLAFFWSRTCRLYHINHILV